MIDGDGDTSTTQANGPHAIGLFQGMFESNIPTFSPGWVGLGKVVEDFSDVREFAKRLEDHGTELASDTIEDSPKGPGILTITVTDGSDVLFDQQVWTLRGEPGL
jgi:hypothetical protein